MKHLLIVALASLLVPVSAATLNKCITPALIEDWKTP